MIVADDQIVRRIVDILDRADLTTITFAAIRRQLEQDFQADFTDKKAFIREQVDLYLRFRQHNHLPQQQHHRHHHNQQSQHILLQHHHHQQQQERYHHHLLLQQQQGQHNHQQQHHLQNFRDARPSHHPLQQQFRRDIDLPLPHTSSGDPYIDDTVQIIVEEEYEEPGAGVFQDNTLSTSKKKVQEKKKRSGGGLVKPCALSEELQAILGERELSRIQVVKALWVYIREKNLQDPDNRRKIICDDALKVLLGCDSTDMFQMNKLLSKHILPLDGPKDGDQPKPKRVKADKSINRGTEGGSSKLSRFMAPHPLSEALINFLGTGESELPRTEVVKRMWDYIKGHQLQDPADKRRIVCDNKLRDLLGCETFNGFGMVRYLSPHFIKS